MDFLKDLIKINNLILLDKISNENSLNENEKKQFILKYNKRNNRLFISCKRYNIDDYKIKIDK